MNVQTFRKAKAETLSLSCFLFTLFMIQSLLYTCIINLKPVKTQLLLYNLTLDSLLSIKTRIYGRNTRALIKQSRKVKRFLMIKGHYFNFDITKAKSPY